jgi:CIC family chloride channel protein
MEHLIPPRDLRSWHSLPVSAIATFSPVVVTDEAAPALKTLLAEHPYRYFPVVVGETLRGIARRPEIESAIAANRPLKLEPVPTTRPGDSIRDSQDLLIESPTQTLVLTDKPDGKVLAIVTLHDMLRAQVSMADREG